jgi:hypothetical protein
MRDLATPCTLERLDESSIIFTGKNMGNGVHPRTHVDNVDAKGVRDVHPPGIQWVYMEMAVIVFHKG